MADILGSYTSFYFDDSLSSSYPSFTALDLHVKKKEGWLNKKYENSLFVNDSKESVFSACFCNCCGAFKKSRECEYCGVIE